MPETTDPVASLRAKSIPVRADAARTLGLRGTPEHIPALVDATLRDRSPAVRLATSSAVAEILSRYRVGAQRELLSDEQRKDLLDVFRVIEPGSNSSLFPILATLDVPVSLPRIAIGLRDPRNGVRIGAGVGLTRLCQSVAHCGNTELEEKVVALLTDRRLKPDAQLSVAQACLAGGYTSALPLLETLSLPGQQAEVLADCIQQMTELSGPIDGLWLCDGLDAGEVNPTPSLTPELAVVTGDHILISDSTTKRWNLTKHLFKKCFRRQYFRRMGEPEPGPAFQFADRTWYPARDTALTDIIAEVTHAANLKWDGKDHRRNSDQLAAERICPLLPETRPGHTARALLLARANQPSAGLAQLELAMSLRKISPFTWYLLGVAREAAGEAAEAREAFLSAQKKATLLPAWCQEQLSQRLG